MHLGQHHNNITMQGTRYYYQVSRQLVLLGNNKQESNVLVTSKNRSILQSPNQLQQQQQYLLLKVQLQVAYTHQQQHNQNHNNIQEDTIHHQHNLQQQHNKQEYRNHHQQYLQQNQLPNAKDFIPSSALVGTICHHHSFQVYSSVVLHTQQEDNQQRHNNKYLKQGTKSYHQHRQKYHRFDDSNLGTNRLVSNIIQIKSSQLDVLQKLGNKMQHLLYQQDTMFFPYKTQLNNTKVYRDDQQEVRKFLDNQQQQDRSSKSPQEDTMSNHHTLQQDQYSKHQERKEYHQQFLPQVFFLLEFLRVDPISSIIHLYIYTMQCYHDQSLGRIVNIYLRRSRKDRIDLQLSSPLEG